MLDGIIAFLAATPFDELLGIAILERVKVMPIWVLIALAILFGWLVMPKIIAYAQK